MRYLNKHSIQPWLDRKSTRLNSSHTDISYAVFCLKKKEDTSVHHAHCYTVSRVGLDSVPLCARASSYSRRGRPRPTHLCPLCCSSFFFLNDRATTEITPLSPTPFSR